MDVSSLRRFIWRGRCELSVLPHIIEQMTLVRVKDEFAVRRKFFFILGVL